MISVSDVKDACRVPESPPAYPLLGVSLGQLDLHADH